MAAVEAGEKAVKRRLEVVCENTDKPSSWILHVLYAIVDTVSSVSL